MIYCTKCGKEINDDAKYCENCGNKILNETTNVKPTNDIQAEETSTANIGVIVLVLGIILITLIAIFAISISNNNSNSNGIQNVFKQEITSSDYYTDTSQGLTSYTITITPKTDIDTCTVELKLYNNKDKLIYADTITKNNLEEYSSYSYTFNFGTINSLSGSYVKYEIRGEK